MSSRPITAELVQQVVDDLQARYDLDADDLRVLGARLSEVDATARRARNAAFAEQFVAEHPATFDRLSR